MTAHNVYHRPRSVREYGYDDAGPIVQPGTPSGYLLPWDAIMDEAEALTQHRRPVYVVLGEYVRDDGLRFPELGVTTEHIERTTNHRWDANVKRLRLVCPACEMKDGKHAKGCDRG